MNYRSETVRSRSSIHQPIHLYPIPRPRKSSNPTPRHAAPFPIRHRRRSFQLSPALQPAHNTTVALQLPLALHRLSRRLSISWHLDHQHDHNHNQQQKQLKEVATTGRQLCSQYVHTRLRRQLPRSVGQLQRLGSWQRLLADVELCCVYRHVWLLADQLVKLRPELYGRQRLTADSAGISDKSVKSLLTSVATSLFKETADITWSRVVSVFALAGGLALECVQTGHGEHVDTVINTVESVCSGPMGLWILSQGGWISLTWHCQAQTSETSIGKVLLSGGLGFLVVALTLSFLFRLLSRNMESTS